MSIKIKRSPKQLEPEIVETVWPGDDAVDLENSDLRLWARHGGTAGLSMHSGKKPDTIRWKPLGDQALSHVIRAMMAGSPNVMDEAFRYGLVGIKGWSLRRGRPVDIRGLEDEALEEVGAVKMVLPWGLALDEVERSQGMHDGEDESEAEDGDALVSLVKVIGAHILARTFRLGQRDA